jgi:hypothetical protein
MVTQTQVYNAGRKTYICDIEQKLYGYEEDASETVIRRNHTVDQDSHKVSQRKPHLRCTSASPPPMPSDAVADIAGSLKSLREVVLENNRVHANYAESIINMLRELSLSVVPGHALPTLSLDDEFPYQSNRDERVIEDTNNVKSKQVETNTNQEANGSTLRYFEKRWEIATRYTTLNIYLAIRKVCSKLII